MTPPLPQNQDILSIPYTDLNTTNTDNIKSLQSQPSSRPKARLYLSCGNIFATCLTSSKKRTILGVLWHTMNSYVASRHGLERPTTLVHVANGTSIVRVPSMAAVSMRRANTHSHHIKGRCPARAPLLMAAIRVNLAQ